MGNELTLAVARLVRVIVAAAIVSMGAAAWHADDASEAAALEARAKAYHSEQIAAAQDVIDEQVAAESAGRECTDPAGLPEGAVPRTALVTAARLGDPEGTSVVRELPLDVAWRLAGSGAVVTWAVCL